MAILKQYSKITTVAAGNYDGYWKFKDILKDVDFGIGTFDHIDGELVGIDGKFYQMKSDGSVCSVDMEETTPFASLISFNRAHYTISRNQEMDKNDLLEEIERVIDKSKMYAVKVSGYFDVMNTRTVGRQEKPYRKLTEVAKEQSVEIKKNQAGFIVGFYTPAEFNEFGVEGLHLHYLNGTHTFGGHALDFLATDSTIELCEISHMEYVAGEFDDAKQISQDEIHEAER